MIRFFLGLAVAIYSFAKIDILIWHGIFIANNIAGLAPDQYHLGWTYALYGFMALGFIFFYPDARRMVMFPLSLLILAFSGLEDALYYWMDSRAIPFLLPWLNDNPLILKPANRENVLLSAAVWLFVVIALELIGSYFDRVGVTQRAVEQLKQILHFK